MCSDLDLYQSKDSVICFCSAAPSNLPFGDHMYMKLYYVENGKFEVFVIKKQEKDNFFSQSDSKWLLFSKPKPIYFCTVGLKNFQKKMTAEFYQNSAIKHSE